MTRIISWNVLTALALLVFLLIINGCASAPPEQPEPTPVPEVVPEPEPVVMPEPVIEEEVEVMPEVVPQKRLYTVVRGDNLWDIADRIYGNPYQWPLIFKDNKSQIEDADLIYPGQVFTIDLDPSMEDIEAAVRHARTRGPWSLGVIEGSDRIYLDRYSSVSHEWAPFSIPSRYSYYIRRSIPSVPVDYIS